MTGCVNNNKAICIQILANSPLGTLCLRDFIHY